MDWDLVKVWCWRLLTWVLVLVVVGGVLWLTWGI